MGDAVEEYSNEPLQRVLIHRINVGEIRDAEEQDLCPYGYRDVLGSRHVDVFLRFLCDHHFHLEKISLNEKRFFSLIGEEFKKNCKKNLTELNLYSVKHFKIKLIKTKT